MSKELREKMAKQAKVHAEKAKVGVRRARQKAISDLRKEGASEDTTRKLEKHVRSQYWHNYTLYIGTKMCIYV